MQGMVNMGAPLRVKHAFHSSPTDTITYQCTKLILVIDGWGTITTPRGEITFAPNTAALLPHALPASGSPLSSVETVTLYIDSTYLRQQLRWMSQHQPLTQLLQIAADGTGAAVALAMQQPRNSSLARCGQRLTRDSKAGNDWPLLSNSLRLLSALSPSVALLESRPPRVEIQAMLQAFRAEPVRAWNAETVARNAHLSYSQLARLSNELLGTSPMRALQRIRTERFAELLSTTDWTVSKCAAEAGWSDPEYASKLLHHRFGMSPREYRHATTGL